MPPAFCSFAVVTTSPIQVDLHHSQFRSLSHPAEVCSRLERSELVNSSTRPHPSSLSLYNGCLLFVPQKSQKQIQIYSQECEEQSKFVKFVTAAVTVVCDCSILYESALGMKLLVTASVESAVVLVEKVLGASQPDILEIEKAKKMLKQMGIATWLEVRRYRDRNACIG
ncbi:hypothetical protein RHMOL_Rhmol07G0033600 [Rhododendron molle]|uniref:Uncharacterized protein n=1 Tax=Rhododendron molle TaxID=49168 RepID=A0ACC0MX78_RHOML|nr:hypothetical protein RHMOL_Rhmol07G0033600 [Rhododendron molle]